MKITLSTAELKSSLSILNSAVEAANLSKEDIFAVFYFEPAVGELTLRFSAKALNFVYTYEEHEVSSTRSERRVFDWKSLASVKFPEDRVILDFTDPSYLTFESGKIKGDLPQGLVDEHAEFRFKPVQLAYKFPVAVIQAHLKYHTYGSHHNPVEADKRSVRIVNSDSGLCFLSFDKQVTAKVLEESLTVDVDQELVPKPFQTILSALPKAKKDSFDLGFSKEYWRLRYKNIDVQMRNLIKKESFDIRKVFGVAESYPGSRLSLPEDTAKSIFQSFSSLLGKKDDNPCIIFRKKSDGRVVVRLETKKFKNVEYELENCSVEGKFEDAVVLNFRYFQEMVSNLLALSKTPISLEWWEYGDPSAPSRGRVLSLSNEKARYMVGRLKRR